MADKVAPGIVSVKDDIARVYDDLFEKKTMGPGKAGNNIRKGYESGSRSINKIDIGNQRRLFFSDDCVKVGDGKWRSLDGARQFRVKPDDYLGKHGIGRPLVPNIPHVHFEFLNLKGNKFEVIKNIQVPLK